MIACLVLRLQLRTSPLPVCMVIFLRWQLEPAVYVVNNHKGPGSGGEGFGTEAFWVSLGSSPVCVVQGHGHGLCTGTGGGTLGSRRCRRVGAPGLAGIVNLKL
jgi:hypothetical protein